MVKVFPFFRARINFPEYALVTCLDVSDRNTLVPLAFQVPSDLTLGILNESFDTVSVLASPAPPLIFHLAYLTRFVVSDYALAMQVEVQRANYQIVCSCIRAVHREVFTKAAQYDVR